MPALKFILSICLLILIVAFAVKNTVSVPLHYYDYQFRTHTVKLPLLLVVLISLFTGFLTAWGVGVFKQMKLKSQLRKQNKTIRRLSGELEKHKSRET
ncbi:MAG: lipopolysaccharide assembly protein LapA domain-containing protein [Nitrospinales bacterium]